MMRQTRICSYYDPQCKHITEHPLTFFSLPESVRDQIYRYVGLVKNTTIRITGHDLPLYLKNRHRNYVIGAILNIGASHSVSFFTTRHFPRLSSRAPYINLGLSNSAVGADVLRFLFSHNEVLLCCEDYLHLSVLLDIPLSLIQSLTRLTIHLNFTTNYSVYDYDYGKTHCYHRSDFPSPIGPPLLSTSRLFQAFLPPWQKLINYLRLSCSNPKLKILCDVADHLTARLVVQPVEQAGLAIHTLRLGRESDPGLAQIAHQAVSRSHKGAEKFPRFLDLPTEIRQHILSFTDLLPPLWTVACLPDGKFRYIAHWFCDRVEFCARHQAVSPCCVCWRSPSALYTASKAMLSDVKTVFWGYNTFIVCLQKQPSEEQIQVWGPLVPSSAILRRWIRQDAFCHLRKLRIAVDAEFYDPSGIDDAIVEDWAHTIDQMASNARALTLSVHLGHHLKDGRAAVHGIQHSETTEQALDTLYDIYEQIFRPLQKLGKQGLAHFFVCALSPFEGSIWEAPITRLHLLERETGLETMVMGSGYDSRAHGEQKTLERESCGNCADYMERASLDVE